MSTYSISTGTSTSANKLDSIISTLNEIADNSTHLITPSSVRDSIYTNWENMIFKPTIENVSGIEYIGIDQNILREKIYFGKKQISGVNVLTSSLLSTDVDIFIGNTKSDVSTQDVKIAFLAGTVSTLVSGTMSIPYLQGNIINSATGSYVNFNIVNTSNGGKGTGNLNILSKHGSTILNGLYFPIYNSGSAKNGYTLEYQDGRMIWSDPTIITANNILPNGATLSIIGSPVIVNGEDFSFTEQTPSQIQVGGIAIGSSFNSILPTDMIKNMLYPSGPPSVILNSYPSVLEVSPFTYSVSYLSYSIQVRELSASQNNLLQSPNLSGSIGFTYSGGLTSSRLSGYVTVGMEVNHPQSLTWSMSVVDTNGLTGVGSVSIPVVYPYFYGTSLTSCNSGGSFDNTLFNNTVLPQLNKVLTSNIQLSYPTGLTATFYGQTAAPNTGSASVYIALPPSSNQLIQIISTDNILHPGNLINFPTQLFGTASALLTSPTNFLWNGVPYTIYYSSALNSSSPLNLTLGTFLNNWTENFQFLFNP